MSDERIYYRPEALEENDLRSALSGVISSFVEGVIDGTIQEYGKYVNLEIKVKQAGPAQVASAIYQIYVGDDGVIVDGLKVAAVTAGTAAISFSILSALGLTTLTGLPMVAVGAVVGVVATKVWDYTFDDLPADYIDKIFGLEDTKIEYIKDGKTVGGVFFSDLDLFSEPGQIRLLLDHFNGEIEQNLQISDTFSIFKNGNKAAEYKVAKGDLLELSAAAMGIDIQSMQNFEGAEFRDGSKGLNLDVIARDSYTGYTIYHEDSSLGLTAEIEGEVHSVVVPIKNITWIGVLSGDNSADGLHVYFGGTGNTQDNISILVNTQTLTFAGGGKDVVFGGTGVDTIYGDTSDKDATEGFADELHGMIGNDYLYGGGGNDKLYGDAGDDYLYGGTGVDFLSGGDGSDSLFGGKDNDHLKYTSGADLLEGGTGNDFYDLNEATEGNATIVFRKGDGHDAVSTNQNLKAIQFEGIDSTDVVLTYDYEASFPQNNGDYTLWQTNGDLLITIISTGDTIFIPNISGAYEVPRGKTDSDYGYFTGQKPDLIFADKNLGQIWHFALGYVGSDILPQVIPDIYKTLPPEPGNGDPDPGDPGDHQPEIPEGYQYIAGTAGADELFGTDAPEVLYAKNGDDVVLAFGGDDIIIAGSGGGNDAYDGGEGFDTVKFESTSAGVTVSLSDGTATGTEIDTDSLIRVESVYGGKGNDTIYGDDHDNLLDGLAGSDFLVGGMGNDTLRGGSGDDYLNGGEGNDVLLGGEGRDEIYGGAGDDTIDGGDGSDDWVTYWDASGVTVNLEEGTVTGQGNDTIVNIESVWGSGEDDSLTGNGQDNGLFGADGNDFIWGVAGNNTLDGGAGDDHIVSGHGDDIIAGGEGNDTVEYWWSANGVTVSLAEGVAHGDGDDTLSSIENLVGSSFDDTLIGDAFDNQLYGDAGTDSLSGLAGNDYLNAADGDDVLNGGDGFDYLVGGEGADTFRFNPNFGHDTIEDFSAGDVIEFASSVFADFSDVLGAAVEVDGSTVIGLDESNSVTLQNVALASLSADEFRFVA